MKNTMSAISSNVILNFTGSRSRAAAGASLVGRRSEPGLHVGSPWSLFAVSSMSTRSGDSPAAARRRAASSSASSITHQRGSLGMTARPSGPAPQLRHARPGQRGEWLPYSEPEQKRSGFTAPTSPRGESVTGGLAIYGSLRMRGAATLRPEKSVFAFFTSVWALPCHFLTSLQQWLSLSFASSPRAL